MALPVILSAILITGEFTIETAYLAANEMMHSQKEQEQQEEVVFSCQLTGAQIRELARIFVEGNEKLLDPFSRETLPIASGVTLTVRETERDYLLQDVLIAGQPIDNNKTYSLGLVDLPDRIQLLTEAALGTGIFETFESSGDIYARTLWVEYLTAGNPMDSPTPYIILE